MQGPWDYISNNCANLDLTGNEAGGTIRGSGYSVIIDGTNGFLLNQGTLSGQSVLFRQYGVVINAGVGAAIQSGFRGYS